MRTRSESISLTMESLSANDINLSDITDLDATGESLALEDMTPTGQSGGGSMNKQPDTQIADLSSCVKMLVASHKQLACEVRELKQASADESRKTENRMRNMWSLVKTIRQKTHHLERRNEQPVMPVGLIRYHVVSEIRHQLRASLSRLEEDVSTDSEE